VRKRVQSRMKQRAESNDTSKIMLCFKVLRL
jgi:hypothetical protein